MMLLLIETRCLPIRTGELEVISVNDRHTCLQMNLAYNYVFSWQIFDYCLWQFISIADVSLAPTLVGIGCDFEAIVFWTSCQV